MILKTTESGSQYRNDATRLAKRVEARAEREQDPEFGVFRNSTGAKPK